MSEADDVAGKGEQQSGERIDHERREALNGAGHAGRAYVGRIFEGHNGRQRGATPGIRHSPET
jgi:hypothetical protein